MLVYFYFFVHSSSAMQPYLPTSYFISLGRILQPSLRICNAFALHWSALVESSLPYMQSDKWQKTGGSLQMG
jgi:hypothetical protein